jgi:hypothetical protein
VIVKHEIPEFGFLCEECKKRLLWRKRSDAVAKSRELENGLQGIQGLKCGQQAFEQVFARPSKVEQRNPA